MRFTTVKNYVGIHHDKVKEKIINIDLIASIEKYVYDERFYLIRISGTDNLIIDRQEYDRICDMIDVSF